MVVFSAIHARMHDAMARVLKLLFRLNKTYLEETEVVNETGELLVKRSDFEGPMNVVPVSDPNIFSVAQRITLAVFGLTAAGWIGAAPLGRALGITADIDSAIALAAIVALVALTVAIKPADKNHHFGHSKAEYFSAGVEGTLIVVAPSLITASRTRQRKSTSERLPSSGLNSTSSVNWRAKRTARRACSYTWSGDIRSFFSMCSGEVAIAAAPLIAVARGALVANGRVVLTPR